MKRIPIFVLLAIFEHTLTFSAEVLLPWERTTSGRSLTNANEAQTVISEILEFLTTPEGKGLSLSNSHEQAQQTLATWLDSRSENDIPMPPIGKILETTRNILIVDFVEKMTPTQLKHLSTNDPDETLWQALMSSAAEDSLTLHNDWKDVLVPELRIRLKLTQRHVEFDLDT